MRKKLLAATLALLLTACGGDSGQPDHLDTFHSNLKYVSFWDSGIRVANTDSKSNNILSLKNTSRISNTATIAVVGYGNKVSDGTLAAINEAISNNQKIILIVWTAFFDGITLAKDLDIRLSIFDQEVLSKYRNNIVAFYIYDEPYLNARHYNVPFSEVHTGLTKAITSLKDRYPEIPSLVTYSYIEVDNKEIKTLGPPSDWVGVNLYHQHLGDPAKIAEYLDSLVAQKKASQDVVLVMDAFFVGEINNNTISCIAGSKEEGSLDINTASIHWANNNPNTRVVAASVFLYNSIIDRGEAICGADSMPKIVEQISAINKRIK